MSEIGRKIAVWLVLVLILVAAAFITFLPHFNYKYPLHGDEWIHLANTKQLTDTGHVTFNDPFTGKAALTPESVDLMESGYYVLWGMFEQVTAAPWIPLFVYMPMFIFMLTVLMSFVLAERIGFGLEAALLVSLIPTSVGILGPAFMVPVAVGLLFIPLALFVAFHLRGLPCYLLLLIIISLLVFMHAPTAIGIAIILAPYIFLNLKDNIQHSIGLVVALAIPFLVPFPWITALILPSAKSLLTPEGLTPWVDLPPLLERFGIIPLLFSFIGIISLGIKGGKKHFGLVLGLLLLALILVAFYRFHVGLAIIYERGLVYLQLLLSIIGGAGIMLVRKLPIRFLGNANELTGILIGLIVVIALVATVIPGRVSYNYYRMIEKDDYNAFHWISMNCDDDYDLALLDPWKATAFTAITGKHVCRRIKEYRTAIDTIIEQYLYSNCQRKEVLTGGGVSLVYNNDSCENTALAHVRNHVYLTNPNLSWKVNEPEGLHNSSFDGIRDDGLARWVTYYEHCDPVFLYPEDGRNGSYCVGIDVTNKLPEEGYPSAEWLQTLSASPGDSFNIGGWIKTENITGGEGVAIVCHWKGPGNQSIDVEQFMPFVKGTSQWTCFKGEVKAPAGTTSVSIVCIVADATGLAWFDDIIFDPMR